MVLLLIPSLDLQQICVFNTVLLSPSKDGSSGKAGQHAAFSFPMWTDWLHNSHHIRTLAGHWHYWSVEKTIRELENESQGLISLFIKSISTALCWRAPWWSSLSLSMTQHVAQAPFLHKAFSVLSFSFKVLQTLGMNYSWGCPSLPIWKPTIIWYRTLLPWAAFLMCEFSKKLIVLIF